MRKVIKIVTFYDDGTFTESIPSAPYSPMPAPHPNPWTPVNPLIPIQPWPSYPPYTVTCKMEDGSTKTIATGPIFAQGNTNE